MRTLKVGRDCWTWWHVCRDRKQNRGEAVHLTWDEGRFTGDLELVYRARRMYQARNRQLDENDVTAFIAALEQAVGDRLGVTIWPDSDVIEIE